MLEFCKTIALAEPSKSFCGLFQALSMDVIAESHLIAVGYANRLLRVIDYEQGSFQDFVGHCAGAYML